MLIHNLRGFSATPTAVWAGLPRAVQDSTSRLVATEKEDGKGYRESGSTRRRAAVSFSRVGGANDVFVHLSAVERADAGSSNQRRTFSSAARRNNGKGEGAARFEYPGTGLFHFDAHGYARSLEEFTALPVPTGCGYAPAPASRPPPAAPLSSSAAATRQFGLSRHFSERGC
jgi:cold shock CspA family protein